MSDDYHNGKELVICSSFVVHYFMAFGVVLSFSPVESVGILIASISMPSFLTMQIHVEMGK